MQQEDFIKRQIEQLSRVLGKILFDLVGLTKGNVADAIEVTNQAIRNELNLDIDEIINLPVDKTLDILINEKKLSGTNLESFADILYQIANVTPPPQDNKANKLFEKGLAIYEYLNATSKTYSLDRNFKIDKIKRTIDLLATD